MTVIDKYKEVKDMYPYEYLFLDEANDYDIINTLKEVSNLYRKYKNNNIEDHQQLLDCYYKIVKEAGDFLKSEIQNSDEITICAALSELLWSGNLSLPHKFRYGVNFEEGEELFGLNGINVLYGKGCCRNISVFFKDILAYLKYNVKTINNCEYATNINFLDTKTYRYDIQENVLNKDIFRYDNKKDIKANHNCIMFLYKLKYMIVYDPTNICIYKLNGIEGKMLYGNGKILIYPHSLMTENNYTYDDMNNFVNYLNSLKKFHTPNHLDILFREGIEKITANKYITDDFYQLILPTLKEANEYRLEKLLKK